MARNRFAPPPGRPGVAYRLDTAPGADSPADITTGEGAPSIPGSRVHADPVTGALPRVWGPDGVTLLHLKELRYDGVPTGAPSALAAEPSTGAPRASTAPGPLGDAELAQIVATVGANVQVFTVDGTWTKPAGARSVEVLCINGGGGGGSGRRGAAATARGGGGGGGGSGITRWVLRADDLSATEQVVVGAGGTGGPAVTVNDTNGATGNPGGISRFGPPRARGGSAPGAGGGGTTTGGAGGTAGAGMFTGGAGATGSGTTAGTAATASNAAAGGGGGGGAVSSGDAAFGGGNGAAVTAIDATAGAAGVVDGAAPTAAHHAPGQPGSGGGGGAGSLTGPGQAGAAGGLYGGGGGGGGASVNGQPSGAGGPGGAGVVVVITYF